MSDGNYNRNLLPYHDYRSGLRAGRAQAKQLAIAAFKEWLDSHSDASSFGDGKEEELAFKSLLDKHIS